MNTELTIILLIKDRPKFTLRWLKYQNENPMPFPVIIADSGKSDTIEKLLRNRSRYPNINYQYIRYQKVENARRDLTNLNEKIHASLLQVKTKYVALASDDDFRFKDSLIKSINFLNSNPDYVASRGEIYDFEVRSGKSSDEENIYGKITSLNRIYTNDSNTGNTALERIRTYYEYANTLWLDVCRTDKLRQSYQTLIDSGIMDFHIVWKLVDSLLVAEGKVHRGDGLYVLHQSHQGGLGNELGKGDPFEWIMSEQWGENISKVFKSVSLSVSKIDKIPLELAYNKIMQYFICFFVGKSMIMGRLSRKSQKPSKIVVLGRVFGKDSRIRILFKRLYLYFKDYRQRIESDKFLKASSYYEEIKNVEDFLIKGASKQN